MPFSILFVCTGNTHRSVAAEYLYRAAAGPNTPVSVVSAGTRAYAGQPVAPQMRRALLTLGVDASPHRSQLLDPAAVARGDLILTATAAHRDRVVQLCPVAMRKTFVLREFLRLLSGASVPAVTVASGPLAAASAEALRARVAVVAAQRGRVPVALGNEDIIDPVGRRQRAVQHCAIEIDALVHQLVPLLSGPGPGPDGIE